MFSSYWCNCWIYRYLGGLMRVHYRVFSYISANEDRHLVRRWRSQIQHGRQGQWNVIQSVRLLGYFIVLMNWNRVKIGLNLCVMTYHEQLELELLEYFTFQIIGETQDQSNHRYNVTFLSLTKQEESQHYWANLFVDAPYVDIWWSNCGGGKSTSSCSIPLSFGVT